MYEKTRRLDENEKAILRKVLETGEITDEQLEGVAGGDCQFCQNCVTGQKAEAAPTLQ